MHFYDAAKNLCFSLKADIAKEHGYSNAEVP